MSETRIPEALALLREKGWCKGDYDDDEGRHCIVGALLAVTDGGTAPWWLGDPYLSDLMAIDTVVRDQHDRHIPDFNDDPATTFADVEFVLEKAALQRGGAL